MIARGMADHGHRLFGLEEFAAQPPCWRASMRVTGSPDDEAKYLRPSVNRLLAVRLRLPRSLSSAAARTGTGPRTLQRHWSGDCPAKRVTIGEGVRDSDDRLPTYLREFQSPSFDLLVAGYCAYPDPGAEFAPEVEKAARSNLLFDCERGRLSM